MAAALVTVSQCLDLSQRRCAVIASGAAAKSRPGRRHRARERVERFRTALENVWHDAASDSTIAPPQPSISAFALTSRRRSFGRVPPGFRNPYEPNDAHYAAPA